MNGLAAFSVTVHHLAPDAKKAGVEFPDVELANVTPARLRGLLDELAKLAPRIQFPVTPEMRIVAAERRFLVQVKEGHIRFSSWSVRAGGCDLTPAQILAAITGSDEEPAAIAPTGITAGGRSRWAKIGFIAMAILGSNAVTTWMLLRPTPNPFLPEYTLLASEPAERLLAGVAGEYRTGANEGDRGLKIMRDGRLHWVKFGPRATIVEESDLSAQAVRSNGQPALLTSADALIEIKDSVTLIFYGDTYRRTAP